jgi:hypothetical protein
MFDYKAALVASANYLKQHPKELLHGAKKARHWRLALPLAALKWLATELTSGVKVGPRDVQIAPCPPGLRVAVTVEQMSTWLRASCVVLLERVTLHADSAQIELRLKNVEVHLLDDSTQSPLAALIRSETLDLSRVASLVAYLPSRPAALIEAVDDRIVVDLMKLPRFLKDTRLRAAMALLPDLLAVDSVVTDQDHLDIAIHPFPRGIPAILRHRKHG